MSLWIGRRMAVGVGVEATRGTGVVPAYWLNCLSFSFSDKPTRALSEAGFGGIWGGDQAPLTLIHAEGDMEVEVGDQSLGALLYAVFGTCNTTGPIDNTVRVHNYTLDNSNQHKSLTINTVDPIGGLTFELAMVDTFELKVEPNKIVSALISFVSKGSSTGQVFYSSYGAEKKFVGRHLSFKVAANSASLDGATKASVKSLSLKIAKNAEPQAVLATVQPNDIVNKRFDITGEIVLNYEDRTWLGYVTDGSYKAVRIDLIHDDTIVGANSTKYEMRLDLSKVEFEAWDPDFGMDEVVTQKLSFHALYDAGGNNNVINGCWLKNAVVSY